VALFAFCFFFARHLRPPAPTALLLLPHLQAANVTAVQIDPAGAVEIRAVRTNQLWQLEKPVVYPAQRAAINGLLDSLQKLKVTLLISDTESKERHATDADYGFDQPQFTMTFTQGDQRNQISVGNRTALGDQVYLRLIGQQGTYVVDAAWLNSLPRSVEAWRDTSLVDAGQSFDWIVLTNGNRIIELRRDPATTLWRMIRPLPARANSVLIDQALQKLQTSPIALFVTNAPAGDLSAYGLQPSSLDLWLGNGSNLIACVHIGGSLTNDFAGDYIQRDGWNTVAIVPHGALAAWRSQVNDFRDPRLFELTQPVIGIDVDAADHFQLQLQGSNSWSLVGQKYPADTDSVNEFIKRLASLKVVEFVKDVVTPVDLQTYGFTTNSHKISLFCRGGGTNVNTIQILFGNPDTNGFYVRRSDEDFIYRLALADVDTLPDTGYLFRDRFIWKFTGEDVTQVTIRKDGKVRQLIHNGLGKWALGPNSQGMIVGRLIEESVGGSANFSGLCQLSAQKWVFPSLPDPEKWGFTTNSLQITLDLKNGEKHTVDFGQEIPGYQTALASVNLDGERWVFLFPPILYQFVSSYLTIPTDVP
jgi:hypothetical protein